MCSNKMKQKITNRWIRSKILYRPIVETDVNLIPSTRMCMTGQTLSDVDESFNDVVFVFISK